MAIFEGSSHGPGCIEEPLSGEGPQRPVLFFLVRLDTWKIWEKPWSIPYGCNDSFLARSIHPWIANTHLQSFTWDKQKQHTVSRCVWGTKLVFIGCISVVYPLHIRCISVASPWCPSYVPPGTKHWTQVRVTWVKNPQGWKNWASEGIALSIWLHVPLNSCVVYICLLYL